MSAFEVLITPTRLKAAKKKAEGKEPTDVIMAPFSAKAIVTFENVPVTKSAKRILNVCNPSEDEIQVNVTRNFSPENNITLEWTSNIIPRSSQIQMEVVWNPLEEGVTKDTLQITDNRNFRKDVQFILKSIKIKDKTAKKFPNISSRTTHTKTLKLKSPTGPKPIKRQSLQKTARKSEVSKQKRNPEKVSPLIERNEKSKEISSSVNHKTTKTTKGKENLSPATPCNTAKLFENVFFTPDVVNKSPSDFDYLASLPTPVDRMQLDRKPENSKSLIKPRRLSVISSPDDIDNAHQRRIPSSPKRIPLRADSPRKSKQIPAIVVNSTNSKISPSKNFPKVFEPKIHSTITKNLSPEVDMFQLRLAEINNKTFELNGGKIDSLLETSVDKPNREDDSGSVDRIINKTTIILPDNARHLSRIDEEEKTRELSESSGEDGHFQKTFDVSIRKPIEDLKRDVNLVGSPLRKPSKSMKDLSQKSPNLRSSYAIQGSMPNLNEMEVINSIEQNRYYYQAVSGQCLNTSNTSDVLDTSANSITSNAELVFNQSEILAQSSRYNLCEAVKKSAKKSPLNKNQLTPKSKMNNSPGSKFHLKQSPMQYHKRPREDSIDSPNSSFLQPGSSSNKKALSMSISPPKRTRINSYSPREKGDNTTIKSNKWSGTQPKKLKLQKTLSLLKKPITPRKVKPEPRVFLYDSNVFLQSCINPDPFAATTTFDPFLASYMYLDDRAVSKHEAQFKKWLNALVTIPAEFDSDCNKKIDVGRIFNEVRNKDLTLAPTKEEQSMNYLTKSRLESLRQAAWQLLMSDDIRIPCNKVAVLVNKKAIRMRTDRDLHLDVVMQKYILELLLCFNPLWLRIGLEAVFGEGIYLQSNADIIGLSTFILNRLFRDKYAEQKYSKAYILSETYADTIKKNTLQRFLFLLLFLDKAKNKKMIKHNPCLFVKSSPYKETREILLRLSSELLGSVGDITRDLKRHGYVLTHKQCYLDEFDYAFSNLAVDLRDGVRLTRIMEIILLRDDLTTQLRVPAISRLQRIFNVNLALKALSDADFILTGNITAADIVDGHREKTLSLLWQIIYKFRAPKFNAAATVIQTWWRKSWLKVVIRRRIRHKLEVKRNRAACIIQAAFRGHIARRYTKIYKWERNNAAICLQKYFRMYLARKRFIIAVNCAVYIQRWYKATKIGKEVRIKYMELKNKTIKIQNWYKRILLARKLLQAAPIIKQIKAEARLRYEKAIIIQRCLKSYTIRRKLREIVFGIMRFNEKKKLKNNSAARIQSFFKMISVKRDFKQKNIAIIKIQTFWRSYLLMKAARTDYIKKKNAAIAVQRKFRSLLVMKIERQNFVQLKSATITVQRYFRAIKVARKERTSYLQIRHCAINIQQRFRAIKLMRQIRTEYIKIRTTIIKIQCKFRAKRDMRIQRADYLAKKSAAMTIQQQYRALLSMRKCRSEYKTIRSKIIMIQRKWRATLQGRKVRLEYLSMQYNTIIIQQQFRANKLMKIERTRFCQLRQAAITIQCRYRAKIVGKKIRNDFLTKRNAAIIIQQRFKAYVEMKIVRINYCKKREAAIFIQRRFREYIQAKKERCEYLKIKNAAVTIQNYYRAFKSMQLARAEYRKLSIAVVTIQRRFRATKCMTEIKSNYHCLRKSVITVQRQFRANLIRNKNRTEYLKLRNAAIVIQHRYRARKKMLQLKESYEKLRNSVINIQRRYRANKCAQIQHLNYLKLKNASIVIQRRFRATKLMNIERMRYVQIKKAVCTIQIRLRSTLLMKKHRKEYKELLSATICIQHRYRALKAMKKHRAEYFILRTNVIKIQRIFRANRLTKMARSQYSAIRNAAITIQQRYRAKLAGRRQLSEYRNLRINTIKIQTIVRGFILMKKTRASYVKAKTSAIKIQQWYRSIIKMRQEVRNYQYIVNNIIIIQTRYRATKKMRKERQDYLQKKLAAIKIQRTFTAYIKAKHQRYEFLKLKESAIIIQRRYRAQKEMLRIQNEYQCIKTLTIHIQRKFRANKAMKLEREKYLNLKSAVIFVQQKYRGRLITENLRQEFLAIRNGTIGLQARIRGYLARERFNLMITPEMREFRKRKHAALIIQRCWRGYRIRNKSQNVKILNIRKRIKELKHEAKPWNTLQSKVKSSVKFLKGRFNIQEATAVLTRLECATRTVPNILSHNTEFIASYCYGIMANAIRSEADKVLIELCSRIMLNLARYDKTNADNTFQEYGLVTISQMLLRWCDKDCGIFNTLCTLIWVFAHCPIKRKKIRSFMTTHDAVYMLRETRKLVLRKDKMRKNIRKLSTSSPTSDYPPEYRRAYPNLDPDFGVIKTKPYTFICSVFAFESVLSILNIRSL